MDNDSCLFCSAKVVKDRETERSRRFGSMTYSLAEEAGDAITGMD
jgi:hypothetical protein